MMIATGLLEAHHASLSLAQTRGGGEGELIVRCRGGDGSGNDVAIAAHDALLSSVCARFALWFSFFSLCLSFFFFFFSFHFVSCARFGRRSQQSATSRDGQGTQRAPLPAQQQPE